MATRYIVIPGHPRVNEAFRKESGWVRDGNRQYTDVYCASMTAAIALRDKSNGKEPKYTLIESVDVPYGRSKKLLTSIVPSTVPQILAWIRAQAV